MGDFLKTTTKSTTKTIFLVTFIFVFLVSVGSSFFIYQTVTELSKNHMYDRSETIAHALDTKEIQSLSGGVSDLKNSSYVSIKEKLEDIRRVNGDIRFIYLLGRDEQSKSKDVFFYVDSEPVTSVDYSPPGQVYDEASKLLISFFDRRNGGIEGPQSDRWGTWMSALSPITLPNGKFVLVGIDVKAQDYIQNAIIYSSIPLLVGFTILVFLLSLLRLRKNENKFLKEKEIFLAVAAHEIRSPLTGIRWATEQLLADPHSKDPQTKSSLLIIYKSSVELITRINNLLSFESFRDGHKTLHREEVVMKNMLKEIVASTALSASSRQISVVLDSSITEHLFLIIDKEKMRLAFLNLINNAIKYTKPNTNVIISYKKVAQVYHFLITDKGAGMTKADMQLIAQMFERTAAARKSDVEGSGIGLALAKQIIELHGGKLLIASEVGKGSVFTVELPQSFV